MASFGTAALAGLAGAFSEANQIGRESAQMAYEEEQRRWQLAKEIHMMNLRNRMQATRDERLFKQSEHQFLLQNGVSMDAIEAGNGYDELQRMVQENRATEETNQGVRNRYMEAQITYQQTLAKKLKSEMEASAKLAELGYTPDMAKIRDNASKWANSMTDEYFRGLRLAAEGGDQEAMQKYHAVLSNAQRAAEKRDEYYRAYVARATNRDLEGVEGLLSKEEAELMAGPMFRPQDYIERLDEDEQVKWRMAAETLAEQLSKAKSPEQYRSLAKQFDKTYSQEAYGDEDHRFAAFWAILEVDPNANPESVAGKLYSQDAARLAVALAPTPEERIYAERYAQQAQQQAQTPTAPKGDGAGGLLERGVGLAGRAMDTLFPQAIERPESPLVTGNSGAAAAGMAGYYMNNPPEGPSNQGEALKVASQLVAANRPIPPRVAQLLSTVAPEILQRAGVLEAVKAALNGG